MAAVGSVAGIDDVEAFGSELSARTADGAAVIADVAVALNGCGVPIPSLTLRTPTLDDVFLSVTGSHLEVGREEAPIEEETTP